nr:hypothetical protein [Tanacetum cinerariifolium]
MRANEIHKFCDGTLESVHKILHERLLNFKFGYNKGMPLREWIPKDKRRTEIMVNNIDDLLLKRRILRSLEVPGDTYVFTVTMEILPEPTSNKLRNRRSDTNARNPIKEILLNLNLPAHKSVLMDPKVNPTKPGRMTKPYSSTSFIVNCFIIGCNNDNERRNGKGKEMSFSDLLLIKYRNSKIDDTVRAIRYIEWCAKNNTHQNYGNTLVPYHGGFTDPIHQEDPTWSMKSYFCNSSQENQIEPRPRDYSFKEWLKLTIGHTNVNKIVKHTKLNEWVLDCFEDQSKTSKSSYSRSLEEYKLVFDIEIK